MEQIFMGIDVAKDRLDVHVRPLGCQAIILSVHIDKLT